MAWALCGAAPALAQTASPQSVQLTAPQLFELADAARDKADYETAETAYRALATNPDRELRTEARFRLALMLADREKRYREAAIELRRILDEQPNAARVRLELARIDALLGHLNDAGRELRAAQAAGLPPEVEQAVRFYAQAIDAHRPTGGSLEIALAPDSNINRATRSGTLSTVIGDFTLNPDAQAHSGLGLLARGQGFVRKTLSPHLNMLARLSGSASVYRDPDFDDFVLAPQIGPDFVWKRDRLSLAAGPAWRWFGLQPYTFSLAASGDWQHSVGRRGQLRVGATIADVRNRRNALESGTALSASAGVDRAFSARFGGGVQLSANRQGAQDPGYATASGGASAYLFREIGRTTAAINLGYSHLEADARLFLFPERRIDNDYVAAVSATFRQVRIGALSPSIRLRYERNVSSVTLYDYRRFSGELAVATAF